MRVYISPRRPRTDKVELPSSHLSDQQTLRTYLLRTCMYPRPGRGALEPWSPPGLDPWIHAGSDLRCGPVSIGGVTASRNSTPRSFFFVFSA